MNGKKVQTGLAYDDCAVERGVKAFSTMLKSYLRYVALVLSC
jgi:hypothetical protein